MKNEVEKMELLLNINQYGYSAFLDSNADTLIIGIENFSMGYLMTYPLNEIPSIIKYVHEKEKKLYLSFNVLANEETLENLEKEIKNIVDLDVDGFVVSDFGILELFKEHGLINKVIFNPITTITNKYSAKIANDLGINHVCVANELNLKDIIEVSKYTNGNVEILAQGYYQICNSKRPLLTRFLNNFKSKKVSETEHYFIKEENRDYAYPIMEIEQDLFIYIDKQRCVLPFIKELDKSNIKYLRIDTVFLDMDEITLITDSYKKVMNNIEDLDATLEILKSSTNSNFNCLNNVSILKKEKENE